MARTDHNSNAWYMGIYFKEPTIHHLIYYGSDKMAYFKSQDKQGKTGSRDPAKGLQKLMDMVQNDLKGKYTTAIIYDNRTKQPIHKFVKDEQIF